MQSPDLRSLDFFFNHRPSVLQIAIFVVLIRVLSTLEIRTLVVECHLRLFVRLYQTLSIFLNYMNAFNFCSKKTAVKLTQLWEKINKLNIPWLSRKTFQLITRYYTTFQSKETFILRNLIASNNQDHTEISLPTLSHLI